jgi:hypothetical protein
MFYTFLLFFKNGLFLWGGGEKISGHKAGLLIFSTIFVRGMSQSQ